jgi:hypothetical protein
MVITSPEADAGDASVLVEENDDMWAVRKTIFI